MTATAVRIGAVPSAVYVVTPMALVPLMRASGRLFMSLKVPDAMFMKVLPSAETRVGMFFISSMSASDNTTTSVVLIAADSSTEAGLRVWATSELSTDAPSVFCSVICAG